MAGCSGRWDTGIGGGLGSEKGGSEAYGGVSVTVNHHVIKTEVLRYDDGNQCIESITSGKVALSVIVEINPGDTDVDSFDIAEEAMLRCDGNSYEAVSISSLERDEKGEWFAVGFAVPVDIDVTSCEFELGWQGNEESMETFKLGLGPEQSSDLPDDIPSCETIELRESFEVRIRNAAGEERVLHGVDAITRAGPIEEQNGHYQFSITYSEEAAETVVTRLREFGAFESPGDMTFLIVLDGEVLMELGFSAELAEEMEGEEWLDDRMTLLIFDDRDTAERVHDVIMGES